MEWFKHSTGSHDDPDISDAIDEFGLFAYSTFFITLEIYGTEFNHTDPDGWLTISQRFLARKLRISSTKVQQILNFYSDRQRIVAKFSGDKVYLLCPKFIEISSNWTKREATKKTRLPTEAPTEAPTAKEEKKKRRRKEKNIKPPLPPCPDFVSFDVWEKFKEHRKLFKPELTEYACTLLFKKLKDFKNSGSNPDDILNQSIENGWKGIFELKGDNGYGKTFSNHRQDNGESKGKSTKYANIGTIINIDPAD